MPRPLQRARFRGALVLCVGVVLAMSLGASAGTNRANQECSKVDDVNVGATVSPSPAIFALIHDSGIDRQYCLNVKTQILQSPPLLLQQVSSGQLDFGFGNPGSLAQALEQGFSIRIVAPLQVARATPPSDNGIFVRAESSIRTMKHLEDKTVGLITLNSAGHAAVVEQLGRAGVNLKKVNLIVFPAGQALDALLAGRIDAVQMSEPFIKQGGSRIRAVIANTWKPYGKQAPIVYVIASPKIAQQADVVRRFQQAYYKTLLRALDPTVLRSAVLKFVPSLGAETVAQMILPGLTIDPVIGAYQNILKRMKKLGFLNTIPDVRTLFIKPTPTGGSNILPGYDTKDSISGGGGNDIILGFQRQDTLNGGGGKDTIDGGPGIDTINGGVGDDLIIAIDKQRDVVNCGAGRDRAYADKNDKTRGCERVLNAVPKKLLASLGELTS